MDILGIGGWELVAIFIIMLVVAGPKRMIQWSYTLGRYVAMLRRMWAETAVLLQKEFDDAGVNVKVPTEPVTRGSIRREVNKAITDATRPLQDTLDEVKQEVEPIRQSVTLPRTMGKPITKTSPDAAPKPPETQNGHTPPSPSTDEPRDFGTWNG